MKHPATTVTHNQISEFGMGNLTLSFQMPDGSEQDFNFNPTQHRELLDGLLMCSDMGSRFDGEQEFILQLMPASALEREDEDDQEPVDAYCLYDAEYQEEGILWEIPVDMPSEVPEPEVFALCMGRGGESELCK